MYDWIIKVWVNYITGTSTKYPYAALNSFSEAGSAGKNRGFDCQSERMNDPVG
jgi:hypothetical protein